MLNADPIFTGILLTLIFSISKPAGGILFGVAFWAMAKAIDRNNQNKIVMLFVSRPGLIFIPIKDKYLVQGL